MLGQPHVRLIGKVAHASLQILVLRPHCNLHCSRNTPEGSCAAPSTLIFVSEMQLFPGRPSSESFLMTLPKTIKFQTFSIPTLQLSMHLFWVSITVDFIILFLPDPLTPWEQNSVSFVSNPLPQLLVQSSIPGGLTKWPWSFRLFCKHFPSSHTFSNLILRVQTIFPLLPTFIFLTATESSPV